MTPVLLMRKTRVREAKKLACSHPQARGVTGRGQSLLPSASRQRKDRGGCCVGHTCPDWGGGLGGALVSDS